MVHTEASDTDAYVYQYVTMNQERCRLRGVSGYSRTLSNSFFVDNLLYLVQYNPKARKV